MLPTKLGRVANRAVTAPSPATACYTCLNQQSTHQRRHSSSKASSSSSSADRYSGKANTPAAKSTSTEESASTTTTTTTTTQTRSTKGKQRREYRRVSAGTQDLKKVATPAEATGQLAALPRVPSVQSWSETDRSISNFFSLHRPVSINHTFPPPSTPESFSKIFSTSAAASDAWADGNSAERRPEDVIYTLHTAIETLENAANGSQEEGVRWEIVHESPSNSNTHHLDGPPRFKNFEEWVAQFKPFRAPPPPQAFPEYDVKQMSKEKKAKSTGQRQNAKPKQKTFTTTITVTESTHANGSKTYSASSSPIVALADAEQSRGESRMTHRERVRKFREESKLQAAVIVLPVMRIPIGLRGERAKRMYFISVKRQRKLKMKKHKYKKLMKRTRNLRRRLDRI